MQQTVLDSRRCADVTSAWIWLAASPQPAHSIDIIAGRWDNEPHRWRAREGSAVCRAENEKRAIIASRPLRF